jgi:hypothetical protein
MVVKWVKKVIPAVPNAPVAPLAKRVLPVAKYVRRANLVNPMIQKRMLVHHATRACIKQIRAKRLVCRAFLERMKTIPVQPNVKSAALGNTKMHRATTRV